MKIFTGSIEESARDLPAESENTASQGTSAPAARIPADPREYGCFRGIDIVIPRGTPYVFRFNIRSRKKWLRALRSALSYQPMGNGSYALFGVKKHPDDTEYVLKKTGTVRRGYYQTVQGAMIEKDFGDLKAYGEFIVRLSETDTDMEPGVYYYSVAASVFGSGESTASWVEVIPPVPFLIRPMMIQAADWEESSGQEEAQ